MAADASYALQTAIRTACAAAVSPYPVYDEVPERTAMPYVAIGDDTLVDDGTKDKAGQEFTVTIHAWSVARGTREAKQLLADIYAALHQQSLTVAGFGVSQVRFEFGTSLTEDDEQGRPTIRHAIHRYRVKLTEA